MPEKNVDAVTLYVGPFVANHHQRMFASGQDLAHRLSIGVGPRCLRLVPAVLFGNQLPADIDANLIDSLIVDLLDMESVVDDIGYIFLSISVQFPREEFSVR